MKLSIDIGYIVKRIIVVVLAFVIISSLKSCQVQALSCDNGFPSLAYKNSSNQWQTILDASFGTGYSVPKKSSFILNVNPLLGIGVSNFSFTYSLFTSDSNIDLDDSLSSSVYLMDGGTMYKNITSQCYSNSFCGCNSYNDSMCLGRTCQVVVSCNATSDSSNVDSIRVQYWTGYSDNSTGNMTIGLSDVCFIKNNSTSDYVVNNSNSNTSMLKDFVDSTINDSFHDLKFQTQQIGSALGTQITGVGTSVGNVSSQVSGVRNVVDGISQDIQDIDSSLQGISSSISSTGTSIINSQQVCDYIDKANIKTINKYFNSSGNIVDTQAQWGITDYININSGKIEIIEPVNTNSGTYFCFYNVNKEKISCLNSYLPETTFISIPNNANYVRFTINNSSNRPQYELCKNGNQGFLDFLDDTFVNDSNLSIGTSYFSQEIDTANNGLLAVITSPISILSRANDTCSSKSFVIFGKTISLPCGTTLFWEKDFSNYNSIFRSGLTGTGLNNARDSFRLFWNVFFGGAIILHLLIKLYMVISDALDPDSCTVRSINNAIDTSDVSSYVPKHSYDYNRSVESSNIRDSNGYLSRSLRNGVGS